MSTPRPPPGFEIDEAPPPPAGFEVDSPAPAAPPDEAAVEQEPGWFDPTSQSGAALRGGSRGASFGFRDELAGGVKGLTAGFSRVAAQLMKTAPGRALMRQIMGRPGVSDPVVDMATEGAAQEGSKTVLGMPLPLDPDDALREGYRFGRGESRRDDMSAQEAHPITYGASEIGGSLMVPGPKLLKPGMPGRMAAIAKTGAAIAGASGLGNSTADLTRAENDPQAIADAVGDTATSAAAGGIIAPLATMGADKAARWLKTASQNNALKALGLRAGISDQLQKRGYETADDARELGQAALDAELIRPFRTASDVAERASFAKQVQGSRIENALADADKAGNFDNARASWDAVGEVMGPNGLTTEAMSKARPARGIVERILAQGEVDPSFSAANRLKSNIYEGINYGTEPALSTRLQRQAASGLRKSIEEQVAEKAGPDVADELRGANKAYGYLADIQPLAQEEATRQLARKTMTPLDLAAMLGAGAAGHSAGGTGAGIGAGLLVGGAKIAGPRIPSTLAVAQRALAPNMRGFVQGALKPALQAPMLPSKSEDEEDAISAFLESP
jgi:hypothetical protein